jgi:hypothetical protein
VLLLRYQNVRLIAIHKDESIKVLLRKHVRLVEGVATLVIPQQCALTSMAVAHKLQIKEPLASKGAMLRLIWRDKQLFELPLAREIDLQQQLIELAFMGPVLEDIDDSIEREATKACK